MTNILCLDDKYSTTRLLTKEKPMIENKPEDKFETILFLATGIWIAFMNGGDSYYNIDAVDDLMEAALLNSDVVYGQTYDFMIPNPNWQHSDETNRANVEKSFEVRFIA